MNEVLSIREQLIIPADCPESVLSYPAIELAAIYSNDKNNLIILEKLLEINKNESTINELLIKIIENIDTTSSIDAIKLLIKYGANVNYSGHPNWTAPIYCCIYFKNIEIMELLIENGADINIKSESNYIPLTYLQSPFTYSNSKKDFEIIKLLIRKGIRSGKRSCSQINFQNDIGMTPMMLCFHYNYNYQLPYTYDLTKLLLDNKADIYIKNNKGHNILKYLENNVIYDKYYSLIFNYKNLVNDHFCECDIDFIYLFHDSIF